MSAELQFLEPEDANTLLQDILAFLDDKSENEVSPTLPTSAQNPLGMNGDRAKQRRLKYYSPINERRRREKKKAEREALRSQVAQYQTQLELLRTEKPIQKQDSKWGWVDAATHEEEKRRKAEELNRQLKGLILQQFRTTQTLRGLLLQEAAFAERVQSTLSNCAPCPLPKKLSTFSSLGEIAAYVKSDFSRLRELADLVFASSSMFSDDESSFGSIACSANLKQRDPLAGSCIEGLSSTPLSCSMRTAVPLLWKMMLRKEVFGPKEGCYTMKTKRSTHSSAEMGYSINFQGPDSADTLDGFTLMEKYDEENRGVLVWTSMMVDPAGRPFFRSQGWVSISTLPSGPQGESVVRMCSRVSGRHFGLPCDGAEVDIPTARKHQMTAKSRLERVQERIMDRAALAG